MLGSNYPDMIDWLPVDFTGGVSGVDVPTRTLHTDFGSFTGDVVNFIPQQRAAALAVAAGFADETGWCPVDGRTFRSRQESTVYVVGDSAAT